MMDGHLLTALAVRVLEVWLLSLGLQPTGDFDPDDPACLRDYGPHRVWTVQARVPDGVAVDRGLLFARLQSYLDEQSRHPGAVKFLPNDIELYTSPVCGDYVFASICHTA